MDLLNQMLGFFKKYEWDGDLTTQAISLYLAIVCKWNRTGRKKIFYINRNELMRLSKIGNAGTYTKNLKALHGKYIKYTPGSKNYPAQVELLYPNEIDSLPLISNSKDVKTEMEKVSKLSSDDCESGIETVALMEPLSKEKDLKDLKVKHDINFKGEEKGTKDFSNRATVIVPSLQEVVSFFSKKGYPLEEARKFHDWNKQREWKTKSGKGIVWRDHVDSWIQNIKGQTKQNPSENLWDHIDFLHQYFLEGKRIFDIIDVRLFSFLELRLNEETIKRAKMERIDILIGSREYSDGQLLQAYQSGDESNPQIINDQKNIEILAKKFSIFDYIKKMNR